MKSLLTRIMVLAILVLPSSLFGQNSSSKTIVTVTYTDTEGGKFSEQLSYSGEEAEQFDLDAFKKNLTDKGYKIETLNLSKEVVDTKSAMEPKGEKRIIVKKMTSDNSKGEEMKVKVEGDVIYINGEEMSIDKMKSNGMKVIETEEDIDGKKHKKVMIFKTEGHDTDTDEEIEIEKEIKVKVDGDDIYINGEKVEDSEMQKEGMMIIKMDGDVDGLEEKRVMILEDGEHSEDVMQWVGEDGNTFVFNTAGDKPRLGVMVDDAQAVNGAEVKEVVEASAAAVAGLIAGDVITKINDQGVYGSNSLIEALESVESGEEIKIAIVRNGQTIEVAAKLSEGSGAKKMIKKQIRIEKKE